MLFYAPTRRKPLTDGHAKAILSSQTLIDPAGFACRVIGWRRTAKGSLGAIAVNPYTQARHLFVVDFATGRARWLTRLV